MKKISLLFIFVAFFGVASFAATPNLKANETKVEKSLDQEIAEAAEAYLAAKATCKVTETWTNPNGTTGTATVTITCTCTTQQACDAAHGVIGFLVPN